MTQPGLERTYTAASPLADDHAEVGQLAQAVQSATGAGMDLAYGIMATPATNRQPRRASMVSG
jgi:hypothetical protein